MPAPDELREQTVLMLAHVYRVVPWGKMRTRHRVLDIWNHRVRAATQGGVTTVGEYVSRLCNWLGLQSAPEEAVALAEQLEPYAYDVLELVYREHIPIAVRARLAGRALRKEEAESDDHNAS